MLIGCWLGVQAQVAKLQSANNAEFEEVRQEGSGFIQLLASHVREAASLADGASRRVSSVERETAANVEEMRGRFEALATTHSELPQLRRSPARPTKCSHLVLSRILHGVAAVQAKQSCSPSQALALSACLYLSFYKLLQPSGGITVSSLRRNCEAFS